MQSEKRADTGADASGERMGTPTVAGRLSPAFGVLAVVLLAINLRPGATSLGPVLAEIQQDLGMNAAVAGMLTGAPGFGFAIFGATAVALGVRVGLAAGLTMGAIAAAVGLLGRSVVGSVPLFLLLTVVAFAGMAIGNVLVPAYIKSRYPSRIASVMSAYTVSLAIGATSATMLSAPIAHLPGSSWRVSLGMWGVVAAVAAVPWLVLAVRERRRRASGEIGPRVSGSVFAVIRSRKALALALFFGMQSMHAYIQFGWIAQLYRDGGLPPTYAGAMVSLLASLGIPAGFVMPWVAARVRDPRPLVVALFVFMVSGYLGVWLAPTTMPWLWAILIGLAGCAFPLAMTLITARTRDLHITTQVSGFTQSAGYLLSAAGPLLVGVLLQVTGSWTAPMIFLLGCAVVFLIAGLLAAGPGFVDDELAQASAVDAGAR
ncbi:MAG: MFS transporter [Propioniciclava sp.]|uniref:CynX/NimT family MFS transporter n=1 Tax=Propioniciclava sp. TaxID=2038686 RepID=UPI0039E6CF3B